MKTSGSKGFHILVPLDGEARLREVWRFAHGAGAVLVKRHPELLTQEFIKADRGERIFVDTGRNGSGATSPRFTRPPQAGRAGVGALHLGGDGARRGRPADVHAAHHAARVAEVGDLWSDVDQRLLAARRDRAQRC